MLGSPVFSVNWRLVGKVLKNAPDLPGDQHRRFVVMIGARLNEPIV
jgi:hypothetical protein